MLAMAELLSNPVLATTVVMIRDELGRGSPTEIPLGAELEIAEPVGKGSPMEMPLGAALEIAEPVGWPMKELPPANDVEAATPVDVSWLGKTLCSSWTVTVTVTL